MKLGRLDPQPPQRTPFRLSHQKFVPRLPGCYALCTFEDEVLYVGLAVDLCRRLGQHIDNPQKTAETPQGRAVWFYWLETKDLNKVERTWLNIHIEHEGKLPPLNRAYSPTAT